MPTYEYDSEKSKSNFKKHRITFRQAEKLWSGQYPLLVEEDDRYEYRERRFKATGLLPNLICIVVIYTLRNRSIRIISARQADQFEREYYYEQSGYTPKSQ
jgi:uncharacterized DUF497 family protein